MNDKTIKVVSDIRSTLCTKGLMSCLDEEQIQVRQKYYFILSYLTGLGQI